MSDGLVTVARHLRERAEAMRSLAELMRGVETQAMMRRLAGDYDLLARHADACSVEMVDFIPRGAKVRMN